MKLISTLNVVKLTEDPFLATNGELYFNSASNVFRYYNSGSWVSILYETPSQSNVFNFGDLETETFSASINQIHSNSIVVAYCTSSCTILIPDDTILNLEEGFKFTLVRGGPGEVFVGGENLLNIPDENYLNARWQAIDVVKIGPDSWIVNGEFPDIY